MATGWGEYNTYGGGPLEKVFPFPFHETSGAPGKGWVAVEIRRIGDEVTWVMDGQIIATISAEKTLFGGGQRHDRVYGPLFLDRKSR